jgi:hypothetical protein
MIAFSEKCFENDMRELQGDNVTEHKRRRKGEGGVF